MHSIQIGSFVLNGQLILYFSFGAAGWLMLQYRLRNMPERGLILSCVSNAFWLWLIVWKASYLLFHPVEVIQQPVSFIYFDGGERGKWMASLVAVTYIWLKASKQNVPLKMWVDILITYAFAGWSACQVLLFMIGEEPAWFHAASAGLSAVLFMSFSFSSRGSDSPEGIVYAIWFSIGHVMLWFLVPDRSMWLLSFNKQQLIFLLVATGLTGWAWLDEKVKKGGSHG
ncbi:hypothetical protein [Brevibacillus composti]|uniref:Uncharacterized protein n=1 Tax=Brevibacillus composti TaxID=2796470 RepID=A0A7T5EKA8_9BACL|nr:hypothetical protein [Brevibacillus composti]QQE74142.1 hypothetical protein JD108_20295 [Brevibacillus composti]QUO41226.1 hypothetical protein KDJ56_20230 [Brevibacillus composti]